MEKRRLGRTDLSIAPLVLGGNVFGWTTDEKTSFELLDRYGAQALLVNNRLWRVGTIDNEGFDVALIPHTVSHTAFSQTRVGDPVNLEVDLVARYVERLLSARDQPP